MFMCKQRSLFLLSIFSPVSLRRLISRRAVHDNLSYHSYALQDQQTEIPSHNTAKEKNQPDGFCVALYAENGVWRENKNKLVEWKALVDTVGIKSADLEDQFLW